MNKICILLGVDCVFMCIRVWVFFVCAIYGISLSTWVSKLLADLPPAPSSLHSYMVFLPVLTLRSSWNTFPARCMFEICSRLERKRKVKIFLRQEEVRVVAAQCFSDGIGCGNCGRRIFWTRGKFEHTGGIRRWGRHKRRRRRRCGSEGVQQACRWERESFRTLICKLIRLRYV